MDKTDRKHTWVHITYERDGSIEVTFVTERWRKSKYLGRRRSIYIVTRDRPIRIFWLLRVLTRSPRVKYTIYSWNGYSVSYERLYL